MTWYQEQKMREREEVRDVLPVLRDLLKRLESGQETATSYAAKVARIVRRVK